MKRHKATLIVFLVVAFCYQVTSQSGIDPNVADIDADVTEKSIKYINFNKWTPEQIAQIQPTVLECCLTGEQARQFYVGKIPPNGHYTPSTNPLIFSREALFYAKMMGLTSNYQDLTVGKGGTQKGEVPHGAELGWDSIKFGDKVVKLPNRLGNLYGITDLLSKDPILLRQNMQDRLEVEGMALLNGREVTVTAALTDNGKVIFPEGSSFEGKGFSSLNVPGPVTVTQDVCNGGPNACIQLTTQPENSQKDPTDSREDLSKQAGGDALREYEEKNLEIGGAKGDFIKEYKGKGDTIKGGCEGNKCVIENLKIGDKTELVIDSIQNELPKTAIVINPGERNYFFTIKDGAYDRINVVFPENGQGGPLTLAVTAKDKVTGAEKIYTLFLKDGEVTMPPEKIPELDSKITVYKYERGGIPGGWGAARNTLLQVDLFSIDGGRAFNKGVPVSLPFSIDNE